MIEQSGDDGSDQEKAVSEFLKISESVRRNKFRTKKRADGHGQIVENMTEGLTPDGTEYRESD